MKLRVKKALSGQDIMQKIEIEHDNVVVFRSEQKLPGRPVPKGETIYSQADLINVAFQKAGKFYVNVYLDDKLVVTRILTARPNTEINHEQEIIQETN